MSNKNTPSRGIPTNAVRGRNGCTNTPAARRLQKPSNLRTNTNDEVNPTMNREILNTAFSKSLPTTPRPKSTALNACYTPSSLYGKTKTTPSNSRGKGSKNKTVTAAANMNANINVEVEHRNTEISNLKVAVRVRPLNAHECTRASVRNVVQVNENELTVLVGTSADCSAGVTHSFGYDHVFNSCNPDSQQYASQEEVFAGTAWPLIDRAFAGYNACLFAYGQTGSGKSYSMMGIEALDDDALDGSAPHREAGIIPRFCHELFRRLDVVKNRIQAEIEVSYFEIYNEKIHDLLCVAQAEVATNSNSTSTPLQRQALKVREHPIWGPYVVDLSTHPVDSYQALRNWLAVGNSQRATAATEMNDKSSRSHSIFNIVLNLTVLNDDGCSSGVDLDVRQTLRSKISLVDLAGSERINIAASGDRIREGVSINKSLLTLGKVIAALSESKKTSNSFVPYRESVLTWLLRENLGGNSKTVMLATISPANLHIEETLATLRYACQARTIVNRVKVNESPHDKIVRELRAEIDRLKSLSNDYERQKRFSGNNNPIPRKIIIETSVDDSEVEALRQQLSERERELARAQKSWMERLQEAENQRKSELRLLRRRGLALELSSEQKQACLVNLAADPILSGTLFYILPPGTVKIGRTRTSIYCSQPDIVLEGPLVAYHHCIIENENGELYVQPESKDFETYLNGELVKERERMYHGDRLVIGGSHYFRISNPFCLRRTNKSVVDFDMAHQEVLNKQEEKLRRELEEEKRIALSRIESERVENERNFKENIQKLELEQLKFKCNSELLEAERKALEEEKRSNTSDVMPYTPTFKSTLLEDINRIMQTPSDESLHKTQLMVKEATQRCRQLGLKLEFRQSQVLDEFGMFSTVILILDKEHTRKAEWPLARLGVWLNMLRDSDNIIVAENVFNSVDLTWTSLDTEMNETILNESLNSSKISLNLSVIKDVFPKQPLQNLQSPPNHNLSNSNKRFLFLSSPRLQLQTKKKLTYGTDTPELPQKSPSVRVITASSPSQQEQSESFIVQASMHVRDLQRCALRLKRLCEHNVDQENQQHAARDRLTRKTLQESLERVECLLQNMRSCLDQNMTLDMTDAVSTKTPKSVRFLID